MPEKMEKLSAGARCYCAPILPLISPIGWKLPIYMGTCRQITFSFIQKGGKRNFEKKTYSGTKK
jgi:hypothetical protein